MPIVNLDYQGATLAMECTNQVEESYRIHSCKKEPFTVAFIESLPTDAVLWDIGANVGPYSLIAAYRGLTVIAIEPGFNNYASMCRNLSMNNLLDRCITLCCALHEDCRFEWFHYQDMRSGSANHVLGGVRKQFFHKQLIQVWTWDVVASWLPQLAERRQYAKIDVDQHELSVLKGAPETLRRLQGVMCEMGLEDEAAIVEIFKTAGLHLAERFDTRGAQSMGEIAYGRFERA